MTKQIKTGSQVFIYNTDGFQEHSKKAVAGVLYRVTNNDGRKSNVVPVDARSQAPNLIVLNHRLKLAGGSTTPDVKPMQVRPVSLSVAHEDAAPPQSISILDTVRVHALHDVDQKFRSALAGTPLSVSGRAANGCLKLQHPSNMGGVNGAGQYVVHPSRCMIIAPVKIRRDDNDVRITEYNGMALGSRVKITNHEFMRPHARELFPLAGTFKVVEIKAIQTVAGRPPRMFFRCAHTTELVLADRFKPAPVYAPQSGPVPVDELAYDVLPTAFCGARGETLEYRLPGVDQSNRAFSHIRKVSTGLWLYATNDNMARCAELNGGCKDGDTNWYHYYKDNKWLQDQNWLKNGHGTFIPALTWPAMSTALEQAFNVTFNMGIQ